MKAKFRAVLVAVIKYAILAGGMIPVLYVALSWAIGQTAINAALGDYAALVASVVVALKSMSAVVSAIESAWESVAGELPEAVVDVVEDATED
jgi:hypothetical protein